MLDSILGINTTPSTSKLQAFDRLKANVKGTVDIGMSPTMVLQGPNKVHKTSVLDTIRLALTGKHPVGGNASDLYELMPPGDSAMDALLTGPSGVAHWRLEAPNGKPKRPSPPTFRGDLEALSESERENVLCLDGIGEMLRFGKDRMREALMRRFGTVTDIPTPMGLNTKQTNLWEEGKRETATEPEPSKQLAAMAKWFRSKGRKYSGDAKSLDEQIKRRMAQIEAVSAGAELLPDYQVKMKKATAWENAGPQRTRKAALEAQIEGLRERARQIIEEERNWSPPDIGPEPDGPREFVAPLTEAKQLETSLDAMILVGQRMLEVMERAGEAHCPMCQTAGVNMSEAAANMRTAVDERVAQLERARADIAKYEALIAEREAAVNEYVHKKNAAMPNFEEVKREVKLEASRLHAELDGVNSGLADVPDSYDGPSSAELRQEIERIKELEVTRKKLFADTEDMHRLRDQSETCKVLERESAKILKELLKSVQSTAEAIVNKYMPDGFRATLIISDKATEWRVMGNDDRAHKRGGMSGSEFGALLVAVACAWTEGSPLRVVLLDDTDVGTFDSANFAALLNALKSAVDRGDLTQVIIAGWREDIPEGWTIVRLGA